MRKSMTLAPAFIPSCLFAEFQSGMSHFLYGYTTSLDTFKKDIRKVFSIRLLQLLSARFNLFYIKKLMVLKDELWKREAGYFRKFNSNYNNHFLSDNSFKCLMCC
ncbi:MAG TPA: hypothetical protein VGO09_00330 [Flavisolibacter sp.]|jgi:hypothetical protein|nr:hypothetical protein [Flavisolibacter sp.]